MHSLDACWVFWCPSVSCGCFPRMPLTVVSYRCTSGFPRCPTVPRLLGVYKCFYGCFLRSFPTVASYGSLRFRRVPVIRVSFRFLRFPTASCGYVLRLPVLGSHGFLQFLWFSFGFYRCLLLVSYAFLRLPAVTDSCSYGFLWYPMLFYGSLVHAVSYCSYGSLWYLGFHVSYGFLRFPTASLRFPLAGSAQLLKRGGGSTRQRHWT